MTSSAVESKEENYLPIKDKLMFDITNKEDTERTFPLITNAKINFVNEGKLLREDVANKIHEMYIFFHEEKYHDRMTQDRRISNIMSDRDGQLPNNKPMKRAEASFETNVCSFYRNFKSTIINIMAAIENLKEIKNAGEGIIDTKLNAILPRLAMIGLIDSRNFKETIVVDAGTNNIYESAVKDIIQNLIDERTDHYLANEMGSRASKNLSVVQNLMNVKNNQTALYFALIQALVNDGRWEEAVNFSAYQNFVNKARQPNLSSFSILGRISDRTHISIIEERYNALESLYNSLRLLGINLESTNHANSESFLNFERGIFSLSKIVKNDIQEEPDRVTNLFSVVNILKEIYTKQAEDAMQFIESNNMEFLNRPLVEPITKELDSFSRYFAKESEALRILSKDEQAAKLDGQSGLLKKLKNYKTLIYKNSIYSLLYDIINKKIGIPTDEKDETAFIILDLLVLGVQSFFSLMIFVLDGYSFLADYHFQKLNLVKYSLYYTLMLSNFDDFKTSLSNNHNIGLLDKVIELLNYINNLDFIRKIREDIKITISTKIKFLEKSKLHLQEFANHLRQKIYRNIPLSQVKLDFSKSEVKTPIGKWVDGIMVSYAIQHINENSYSRISEWSESYEILGKATPTLQLPVDTLVQTRLIYRRFNSNTPELVGIVGNRYQTEFRDIDKDLFNVASRKDEVTALEELKILINNGADGNAKFDNGRTAVHTAALNGNAQMVLALALNGAGLDVKDENGYSPIHLACEFGHEKVVEVLMKNRAEINIKTNSEYAPLHIAAEKNHAIIVNKLLQSDTIDVNAATFLNFTALHVAAAVGNNTTLNLLIQDKRTDLMARSLGGFTSLHVAVSSGNSGTVAILSQNNKIDVNANSAEGLTPLHLAAIGGFHDVSRSLLEIHGIELNSEAAGNMTALHFASVIGNLNIIKLLLQKTDLNINGKTYEGWSSLHLAVALGNNDVVSELLKVQSIETNAKGNEPLTSLHLAAVTGQNIVVLDLINNGALIEEQASGNLSALHFAAMFSNEHVVATLINKGDIAAAKAMDDLTPLHLAAIFRNKQVANNLLQISSITEINSKAIYSLTPLHFAAASGDKDIVLQLMEYHADIDAQDIKESTPLYVAFKFSNIAVVKALIDAGADVNIRLTEGKSLLHVAALGGHHNAVLNILKNGVPITVADKSGCQPIHYAASTGTTSIIKLLINEGAEVDAKCMWPQQTDIAVHLTPLHLAVYHGHKETVIALLDNGADINEKSSHDNNPFGTERSVGTEPSLTPLHWAAKFGNEEILNILINKGADLYSRDILNDTPIHLAAAFGRVNIVKALLLLIPSLAHSRSRWNFTPLHYAAWVNYKEVILALLEKGADINAKDHYSNTPLQIAAATAHKEAVLALLEKGADINAKAVYRGDPITTEPSVTALHLAAINGHTEIVRLLLNKGADFNAKDNYGNTPEQAAETKAQTETINAFKMFVPRRRRAIKTSLRLLNASKWMISNSTSSVEYSTIQSSQINGILTGISDYPIETLRGREKVPSANVISFPRTENYALLQCLADASHNPLSNRYHSSISQGVQFIPNNRHAVDFAVKQFDSFVKRKMRNLSSQERIRVKNELIKVKAEIIASFERGLEFSGNVGLEDVLRMCKECFIKNILT